MSELSPEQVVNWLRMPRHAIAHDGATFAVEWHADEMTQGEVLGQPLIYHMRGRIDRPSTEQHIWVATIEHGLIADLDTPAELTIQAEDAFFDWVGESG